MDVAPARVEQRLERIESARELVVRLRKRRLGVDAQLAREVRDRKQQIPEFIDRLRAPLRRGRSQFAHFLLDLVDDPGRRGPVEANRRDARANRMRAEERRQRARDTRQHPPIRTGRSLLPCLNRGPLLAHRLGRRELQAAACRRRERPARCREHVRMADHELGSHGVGDIGHVEAARLAGNLRVKDDLQEYIAEFAAALIQVAAIDRIDGFVSLFEQVAPE